MRRSIGVVGILFILAVLWLLVPPKARWSGATGPGPTPTDGPGVVVFDLQDDADDAAIERLEQRLGIDLEYSSEVSRDEALMRASVADVAAVLRAAADEPLVEVAEPVVVMEELGAPNDPMWDQQWNMRMIGAQQGWDVGAGRGVKVAVIDTGVAPVEDLEGVRIEPGRSFVPGVKTAVDDRGHGTHVAGTIAQATNNNKGVAGIAPGVTLVPYKVLSSSGSGQSDWVAAAIDEAADRGADIINLSLGGPHSRVVHTAAEKAARRGVIVVASAGNTGRQGVGCPGHVREVIGVAAVGPDGSQAPYSSFGEGVEIAAPGGDKRQPGGGILQDTISPSGGHAYLDFQGTSMAAPHVSGAAAVLLGMGLDPDAAVAVLYDTATDRGAKGFDPRYGHGNLDLAGAVGSANSETGARLFAAAGLLGLLLGVVTGLRRGATWGLAGVSAVVAGGLFFLPWLGLGWIPGVDLLSRGLWAWPAELVGPDLLGFPLWASALLPLLVGVFIGAGRRSWLFAAGMATGFAVALWWAARSGWIDPWWPSDLLDTAWLVLNAVVCLVVAMGVIGMRLNRAEARNRKG